ncbi:hypothetical protein THAOC_16970, partial [Thalassiosira oceanica]
MLPYTLEGPSSMPAPFSSQSASPEMDGSPYYDAKIPSSAGSKPRAVTEDRKGQAKHSLVLRDNDHLCIGKSNNGNDGTVTRTKASTPRCGATQCSNTMIIHVSGAGDSDLSFIIKNTTRMSRVFEAYASRQLLDETLLCFQTAAGVVVSGDDTAHSLDLQDGDTLKCSETDMTIHVSGVGCDLLEYKIRRSKTRMSRMFQDYANILDLNPARLCFETAAGVAVTGDDTAYSLNLHDGDTLRCIWIYTGEGEKIPHTVTHVRVSTSVTKLPRMAFHGRGRLAVVELHEGLVEIGYGAFDSCTSLASIQLPSSVETDCCSKLSHMVIPEGGRLWLKDEESLRDIEVLHSIVSAAWEVLLTVESPFLEAKQQQIAVQSTQQKNILKKILSLLKANEQQIEEQSTQQTTILKKIEEVQGIALAVTQHLLAIDDGILIEAPLECVNRIIQTSKAIYNRIEILQYNLLSPANSPTNDRLTCTTEKFFVFWRTFSLRMVRSSSSSLKSFGWGQITQLVDESNGLRSPQGYLVSGSGTKFVNGIYMLDPEKSLDGKARELEYTRIVPDNEKEGAGKKITLFRCTMRSRQKWWFLSEADEHQPGTDMDIDYYQHKSQKHEEESPSLSGWLIIGRGKYPPPTLEPLVGPSSDERSSIKNQLVEWVEENVLNEAARDICLSSKVARSVMSLYKFMTTYQELHRKSVNLTGDHIQQILSVCQKTTNLVALTELYLQFIIIRPSLPSNLHTIFDQAICRIKLILERQTHLEDVSFESDEDVASVLRLLIDCYKSDSFVWPDSSKHLEILKTFSLRLVKSNLQIAMEAGWDGVNILLVELSHGMHSMTEELADWIESNKLLSLALGCTKHHEAIAMARSMVTMEEEFLHESHLQIALDTCRNTDSADVVAEMHEFIASDIDLLSEQSIIADLIMQTAVTRRIELNDPTLTMLCIGNEGTGLWHGETLLNLDHLEADDILRIGNAIEQKFLLTRINSTDDASFEDLDEEV